MRKELTFLISLVCMTASAQTSAGVNDVPDSTQTFGYFGTTTQNKASVIDASQMNNKDQVTSALDAIRGRVAGLQVERTGGTNAMSAVRLRGTTSLTGSNDPLIIVDGVMGDLTLLQSIYPTDIESFTILKDASETAQYGSRGAAGVIEIKTLRGHSGRMRIGYNGSFDIAVPYKRLNMLSADGYRDFARQHNLPYLDKGTSTDFQREIERTALTHQHHVAFAGGSETGNYRVSVGYNNEQEVIKDLGSRSFMASMNMTQTMWDGLMKVDLGMFGSTQDEETILDRQKLFYSAAAWNPTFPNHPNSSGNWDGYPSASQINNPLALLSVQNHTTGAHISTYAKFTFHLLPELTLTGFGAYTYVTKELMGYQPTTVKGGGEARRQTSRNQALLANAMLTFKKSWGIHALKASALAEVQTDERRSYGVTVTGFSDNVTDYDNLSAGSQRPWDGTKSYFEKPKMASFMGQASYTLLERYTLNGTLRADGSSKFGDNHKWGYFPSLSFGYNLGREAFIQRLGLFDDLQLNIGLGWAGNQGAIDSYTTMALVEPNGTPAVGQGLMVTLGELKNDNPELKWEVTRTWNLGINAQLLHHRLYFSANYYRSKTYDMLYPYTVSVPPFKYPKIIANMGSMQKSGLELAIGGTPYVTRDLELNINANVTFQRNKLLSLSGKLYDEYLMAPTMAGIAKMNGAGFHGYNDVVFQIIGEPLGSFYLPLCLGIEKVSDDGDYEYITGGPHIAGQATPKVLLGSNISLRYKDFDITAQVNGAFGHKIFNGTALSYYDISALPLYNVMADAPERGIASNAVSDYWLESGDYVNIDYITIGWRVPIPQNRILESMRLSLSMNNVATFTGYSGLTPMINSSSVNGTLGLDDKRTYPLFHSWALGVSMNF